MKRVKVLFDSGDTPRTIWDSIIEILLGVLLIFCPLAFGAVEGWSEEVVICLAALMTVCLLLKLALHPEGRFVCSWACLPIAIFLLIVLLQLMPLPAGLVRAISPATARMKSELLSDLPDASKVL